MKIQMMALGCLLLFSACATTHADAQQDEAAIATVFVNFTRSWDQPGMPGFETLFTDDADFVVVTGRWLKGRTEIVQYHRELLRTVYAGSHSLPPSTTVRLLSPDIAIAHVATGARYTHDGAEQVRTGLATATLVKREGRWLITAFQNTLTSGPGALKPLSSK